MDPLKDQINQLVQKAMKAKDAATVSILRLVRAAIKNKEIDTKADLKDPDVIAIIQKMVKQTKEALVQFEKGGRQDLVAKAKEEISILLPLLPKQMDLGQLQSNIQNIIKESGVSSMKQMGQVMKEVTAKFSGKVDMKEASRIVRELLSKSS